MQSIYRGLEDRETTPNWLKVIGSDGGDLVTVCVEGLFGAQHAPGDPRQLVGEGGGQLVAVHSRRGAL